MNTTPNTKTLAGEQNASAKQITRGMLSAPSRDSRAVAAYARLLTDVGVVVGMDWSYPTSTHATRAGYGRTGCWTVSAHPAGKPGIALDNFSYRADAASFARSLAIPIGKLWEAQIS